MPGPLTYASVVTGRLHQVEDAADSRGLEAECALFSRYLVSRPPSAAIIRRYVRAHRCVLSTDEDGLVAFVMRRPWTLPYLDAACGVCQPDGPLRRKLLVLTAILEATPELADYFLHRPIGRASFVVRALYHGAAAVLKSAVGLVLFRFVEARA